MKNTNVIGFVLMTLAAVIVTCSQGVGAILPAATAFVGGMYLGLMLKKGGN